MPLLGYNWEVNSSHSVAPRCTRFLPYCAKLDSDLSNVMPYPTIDQFKELLATKPLEDIVTEYVFSGVPFVFRNQPDGVDALRQHLSKALGLIPENILVVGSAKIGFSLNPDRFPRQFSSFSDIDVLVVDSGLFDRIWTAVLKWHYPRKGSQLGGQDAPWMRNIRRHIYWGAIMPNNIRYVGLSLPEVLEPIRDLSTAWFDAFHSLSLYPEFSAWDISGLLYRSWEHARLYHVEGLRRIKVQLRIH